MFESFHISQSGMTVNRLWLDTISNNIANINTVGSPDNAENPPYRRRIPLFAEILDMKVKNGGISGAGVTVTAIIPDRARPGLAYNPSHPYANQQGYVARPNIEVTNEMANMMAATRAYEANATVLQATKDIAQSALRILTG